MSVDTTHNLYKKYINQTKLCRDILEGTETIVKNASIYTPFLTALDKTENEVRVKRASFRRSNTHWRIFIYKKVKIVFTKICLCYIIDTELI